MAITKVSAALTNLDGGVVINESSADADFRVESNGNANMLFVDGGNDRVGIGTGSPSTNLHIYSTADNAPHLLLENFQNADTDDAPVIELYTNDQTTGGISDDTDVGVIRFTGDEKDAGGKETYAEIRGVAHDPGSGSSNKGNLSFFVQAAGDLHETLTLDEKNVNIVSDSAKLQLGAGNDLQIYHDGSNSHIRNDFGVLYIDQDKQDGNLILRCDDGSGGLAEYIALDGGSGNVNLKGGYGTTKLSTHTNGVGIGTTSPSYTLDVNSSGNSSAFRVSNSTNGQDINCTISNSGTTAGDDSLFELATQAGAGDPKVRFSIAGNENYEIGIDNTDSDKLKISQGTALGTDDRIVIVGGSVGIGNDNPGGMHSGVNRLVVGSGSGNQGIAIWSGASNEGAIGFARSNAANSDAYDGIIEYSQADRSMRFGTNAGTERMRLKTGLAIGSSTDPGSGNLFVSDSVLISRSSQFSPASKLVVSAGATGGTTPACSFQANTSTSSGSIVVFYNGGGTEIGSVGMSNLNAGTSISYNTSSDARLKDVTGEAKGLEVINALNPVAFNWKVDNAEDEGLLAQEVMEIVPNAVSQGSDEYYQMDYSKLVTPLIKAIQELSAEVEKLKQQINK